MYHYISIDTHKNTSSPTHHTKKTHHLLKRREHNDTPLSFHTFITLTILLLTQITHHCVSLYTSLISENTHTIQQSQHEKSTQFKQFNNSTTHSNTLQSPNNWQLISTSKTPANNSNNPATQIHSSN